MADDTLTQVEEGLQNAEKMLPMLTPLLMMIPGFGAIVPFLQLIPVIIEGVKTIQKATGVSQSNAITQVRMHLTPGMPNAAALTSSPDFSDLAPTVGSA